MKKLLVLFILLFCFGAQASFYYWFNSTKPGTRHFWENGAQVGSRYFWENGTGAGSRFYWENGKKYPSRYFWENSTKPGSAYYWNNGTGPGSRYFFENGAGPGSRYYWENKDGASFDVYFVSMCKSGVIDIPPCDLMIDSLDPFEVLPFSQELHYCEEMSPLPLHQVNNKLINSKQPSK